MRISLLFATSAIGFKVSGDDALPIHVGAGLQDAILRGAELIKSGDFIFRDTGPGGVKILGRGFDFLGVFEGDFNELGIEGLRFLGEKRGGCEEGGDEREANHFSPPVI